MIEPATERGVLNDWELSRTRTKTGVEHRGGERTGTIPFMARASRVLPSSSTLPRPTHTQPRLPNCPSDCKTAQAPGCPCPPPLRLSLSLLLPRREVSSLENLASTRLSVERMLMGVLLLGEFQFAPRSAAPAHRALTVSSATLDAALTVLMTHHSVISTALLPCAKPRTLSCHASAS